MSMRPPEFEDTHPAYEIGKAKRTVADLQEFNHDDIQKKYHEFATILRQHNVSGRENAFDKLVNLFLVKIVDEMQNPEELMFYWRGVAFDNYYDLQDRIQRLYRDGMQKFLNEEVTYIDNDDIKKAFRLFENEPDATRDQIEEYFRQLKFYTNNDFAFLDVHNYFNILSTALDTIGWITLLPKYFDFCELFEGVCRFFKNYVIKKKRLVRRCDINYDD